VLDHTSNINRNRVEQIQKLRGDPSAPIGSTPSSFYFSPIKAAKFIKNSNPSLANRPEIDKPI
jgi:hypothetical protein